jgi:hypothetical protein
MPDGAGERPCASYSLRVNGGDRPVADGEPTLVKRFRGTVYGSSRPTEPDGRA